MKEQPKKRREKKQKKFNNRPNYGYYSPKVDPSHQQFLVTGPNEAVAVSVLNLHRNVTVRKKKREKEKVTRRSLKKRYRKEKKTKNTCY